MSVVTRAMLTLLLAVFCVKAWHVDDYPFVRRTEGTLTKVDTKLTTRKLSRSQIEYSYLAPDIEFVYEVEGRRYRSTSLFAFTSGWASTADTAGYMRGLWVGRHVTVWFDCRHPESAWLRFLPSHVAAGVLTTLGTLAMTVTLVPKPLLHALYRAVFGIRNH